MHRLDRTRIPAPPCLAKYRAGTHAWSGKNGVSAADKEQIRAHLEALQGRRCAYCEGSMDALGSHIEHFRRRQHTHFPQLTFEWSNLFWSCDQSSSCGHFKDTHAGEYDPDDLLDPTVDDPEQYFLFLADGTIRLREGLSERQRHRAQETLRVFNLMPSHGRLVNMRKAAAHTYFSSESGIFDALMTLPEEDRREYVERELERTATHPFCTVIRHFLQELTRA